MEKYQARYRSEDLTVGFEVGFNQFQNNIKITYKVYIFEKNSFVPINQLSKYDELLGETEVHIRGFLNREKSELQIENIQRGIINSGQCFLVNTINKLLSAEPEITSVYLANINNYSTLKLIQYYKEKGLSLKSASKEKRKPLISALDECGFTKQEIITDGSYYGIRGSL